MRVYNFKTPVYEFTTLVYKFTDTGIQFADTGRRVPHKMYGQYTISQTLVYEFTTPVYDFADTGIRVRRHQKHEFFVILGDLKGKIEISKDKGGLKISPKYGIKQKKSF